MKPMSKGEIEVLLNAFSWFVSSNGKDADDGFFEDAESDTEDTDLNRLVKRGLMARWQTRRNEDGIMGYAGITDKGIHAVISRATTLLTDMQDAENALHMDEQL